MSALLSRLGHVCVNCCGPQIWGNDPTTDQRTDPATPLASPMDTVYNFHEMIDIIDVICTLRTELHPINDNGTGENGGCSDDVVPSNLVECKVVY